MVTAKAKGKRKATSQDCAVVSASTPTPRQEKVSLMLQLARQCGFVCVAQTEYSTLLANEISTRLVHRTGVSVYQSVNFTIPCPRDAAISIFGEGSLTMSSEHKLNWKLLDVEACAPVMDSLCELVPSGSYLQGMSRALMSASEKSALVIATIMPTLEATWQTKPKGGSFLTIGFMYILFDADGEMHSPKDEARREILVLPATELALRQRVLFDAKKMIDRGVPLSSGWYAAIAPVRCRGRESPSNEGGLASLPGHPTLV